MEQLISQGAGTGLEDYFRGREHSASQDYDRIRSLVDLKDRTVLDLGTGTGGKGAFWKKMGARRVVGVDLLLDPVALRGLAGKVGLENMPDLAQADGAALPFADEAFDVITIHDVFEHLLNPQEVLEECFRVLVSGGLVSIITPHYYGLSGNHLWNYLGGPLWRYLHPHLLLPRRWLHRLVLRRGRQQAYADDQIKYEWQQFVDLNRLRIAEILRLLGRFRVVHFKLRTAEKYCVRMFAHRTRTAEYFSYSVVIIAAKPGADARRSELA